MGPPKSKISTSFATISTILKTFFQPHQSHCTSKLKHKKKLLDQIQNGKANIKIKMQLNQVATRFQIYSKKILEKINKDVRIGWSPTTQQFDLER
jgi:hypothetical protein